MTSEPLNLDTAMEYGREEAQRYPQGPWPAVLAEVKRLQEIEARARDVVDAGPDDGCDGACYDTGMHILGRYH